MKMNDVLTYFSLKYEGNFHEIYEAVQNKEEIDADQFMMLKKKMHHKRITLVDSQYPDYFKEINCPPIVLFYTGNKKLYEDFLPVKEIVMEDYTRAYCSIMPTEQNGKIVFDYVIGCENHDHVDYLLNLIQSKGLPLKDYSIQQNKNEMLH